MTDNAFTNEKTRPTPGRLKKALGKLYPSFEDLIDLTEEFKQEWKFYKSSGWLLKVFDRRKALFWLIPQRDGFRISFALRELERTRLLDSRLSKTAFQDLKEAKKYPEGYSFQVGVATRTRYRELKKIVKLVMGLRG